MQSLKMGMVVLTASGIVATASSACGDKTSVAPGPVLPSATTSGSGGMGGGGAGGDGANATSGEGGAGAEGGADGQGGEGGHGEAVPSPVGLVVALSGDVEGMQLSRASAGFADAAFTTCTVDTTIDDCSVQTCPVGATGVTEVDGGPITVAGDIRTATVVWNGSGYESDETSTLLFSAGSTVTMSGAGSAAVPAFSDSLVAPSQIDVTAPSFAEPMIVDRSRDWTLTWSGGTTGTYRVAINAIGSFDDPASTLIECLFDASAGTGTVPTTALSNLPATTIADIITSVQATKNIPVGDRDVTLQVTTPATASDSDQGFAVAAGPGAVVIQ